MAWWVWHRLTVGSPVPACLCAWGRRMRSSPAAGQRWSCCFSFGTQRAGAPGEPLPAPSTLDQLTAPLTTRVPTDRHRRVLGLRAKRAQRCCHSRLRSFLPQSFSVGPCCRLSHSVCPVFVARAPVRPHTCWGGCVRVCASLCVFVVQPLGQDGRSRLLWASGQEEVQQEPLHSTSTGKTDTGGE